MSSTVSNILKIVLLIAILFLGYYLYEIIMEPIRFEEIKERRYTKTKDRLEQIRNVQKAYRAEYNEFAPNLNALVAFVDTGKQAIIERKDSSFTYYDDVYQQERMKDTIITRVIGYRDVKASLFPADFDASQLQYIPFTENEKFIMEADKLTVNEIVVPVFEARAPNEVLFADILDQYRQFIDVDYGLQVGSLTEPTLSGNWR